MAEMAFHVSASASAMNPETSDSVFSKTRPAEISGFELFEIHFPGRPPRNRLQFY